MTRQSLTAFLCRSLTAPLSIAAALWAWSPFALGQTPTRIVVPFAAGGATDALARLLATELGPLIGTVIVENKPGGSSIIAADYVAKSTPDGKTLFFGSNSSLVNNTALFAKLPYDPLKDFIAVSHVAYQPMALWARTDLPFKTLPQFIAYSRANPGKLNRGTGGGVGTVTNLAGVMFEKMAGLTIVNVPFGGDAPAMQAMLGGDIELYVSGITSVLAHVKSGKVRGLAVMDTKRLEGPDASDVPTFKEAGFDVEAAAWFCLVAPTGTPKDAIDRLNKAVNQVLHRSDITQRLHTMGMEPRAGAPEDVDRYIRSETQRWVRIIKDLGIKPE